jgi:hypothetical protein
MYEFRIMSTVLIWRTGKTEFNIYDSYKDQYWIPINSIVYSNYVQPLLNVHKFYLKIYGITQFYSFLLYADLFIS